MSFPSHDHKGCGLSAFFLSNANEGVLSFFNSLSKFEKRESYITDWVERHLGYEYCRGFVCGFDCDIKEDVDEMVADIKNSFRFWEGWCDGHRCNYHYFHKTIINKELINK